LGQFRFEGFDRFRDARNFALIDDANLLPELGNLEITIRVSDGETEQETSYQLSPQGLVVGGIEVGEGLYLAGNLYKFSLGEQFDGLMEPGRKLDYTITITQTTRSNVPYQSGIGIEQTVDRVTPNPPVQYQ
jgi:hypothetical protein